ncbi:MAG: beta-carotene 15,15'-dioxygenase, Brp/Blh family [Gammaproteobacteria bacterium]|nr:beta-carotene 15,15'-dioxygenase, Brp/Blh family [Gammaproteobacteria bacterium]MBT5643913.1 beta-carotene 15,15'-dioxygenase, Brp/Blh family [Gammaproteobacteria bacterium]MBT5863765.1 beta-carotene 15,15'-dioxygenase, Brp/Blh family [Gammaproteobacteria bacterium]MBT6733774.1 beta-carotene 15,15'-dioxygenase, Brp/Blh family [Gammaproteobacteria bacterium]
MITVTIIGIPHGFFDYSVAERLFKNHINWVYYFTAGYISLSLIYLLFWIYYPIASLIFFLMISIFHFGIEELNHIEYKDMSFYQIFVIGSMPIALPILFHSSDVFYIFNQIIGLDIDFSDINMFVYYLYFILLSVALYLNGIERSWVYLILILNFIVLPPLLSFILYFCFHHSIRHYIYSIYHDSLVPKKYETKKYLQTIIITSVFFTIIVLVSLQAYGQYSFDVIIVKYIFILLACLTLPHLILNIYYDTKKLNS